MAPAFVNRIKLDRDVLLNEFRGEAVVRDNAAHAGRREEYVFRPLVVEECSNGALVSQVKLAPDTCNQVRVACGSQAARYCRTDQPIVASDEDLGGFLHRALRPLLVIVVRKIA